MLTVGTGIHVYTPLSFRINIIHLSVFWILLPSLPHLTFLPSYLLDGLAGEIAALRSVPEPPTVEDTGIEREVVASSGSGD